MTVTITLTTPGVDTGPFDLYSNLNYASAFESGVTRDDLISGYLSALVPNGTTTIKVKSNNVNCTSEIFLDISGITTTTTTTTAAPTTTTTTTTIAPVLRRFIRIEACDQTGSRTLTYNASYVFNGIYQYVVSANPSVIKTGQVSDTNYQAYNADAYFVSPTQVECSGDIPNPDPPPPGDI